jgi:XTP/dITP diphosphohydrolase
MIKRINLVTGNAGKAAELAALLGIEVTAVKRDLPEIQSLDAREVAARKAADALQLLGEPVLVDDTGLAVEEWNGLPGALIAWFIETVGLPGILKMAEGLTDRRATVTTALGYAAPGTPVQVFQGTLRGSLTTSPRGTSGFGYDPIFIPEGGTRTYAEMTPEEKNRISHRWIAVEQMKHSLGLA